MPSIYWGAILFTIEVVGDLLFYRVGGWDGGKTGGEV
jgi:hypothetical protein